MSDATRRCCTRQGGQQRRVIDGMSDCTQNKGIQCNFDSFFQIMDELAAETMVEKKSSIQQTKFSRTNLNQHYLQDDATKNSTTQVLDAKIAKG